MINDNDNDELDVDLTDLPTDEYPVLNESTLSIMQGAAATTGADDAPAETKNEPAKAAVSLTHLEAEVSRLHGKWQSIDAEFKNRDTQISELHEEIKTREGTIAKLTKQIDEGESKHKDALEKLARAAAEATRLNDLLMLEQVAAAGAAERTRQSVAEQDALRGKLQDLEIYINGRHDKWAELNAELVAHKDALREKDDMIAAREAAISRHDEENRQLAASIRDLERQCSELTGRRKEREEAYDELQKSLASQLAQTEQLKGEYAVRAKETEHAAKLALDSRQHVESLERGLAQRDASIAALTAQLADRTAEVVASHEALQRKSQETDRLTDERDAAQKESARVRVELDALGAHASELGRLHADAAAEIRQLKSALAARSERVTELETELRVKQATADMLERSVTRITDLGASLAALDQRMNGGESVRDAKQPAPQAAAETLHVDLDVGERSSIEAGRKLVITIDGQSVDYPILKKHVTIGRGHGTDIRVASHFVSRVHATIKINGTTTIIEDAGSKNGVLVNDERIMRRALRDGDVVTLGDDLNMRFVDATH